MLKVTQERFAAFAEMLNDGQLSRALVAESQNHDRALCRKDPGKADTARTKMWWLLQEYEKRHGFRPEV